jgi:hypothetical protein
MNKIAEINQYQRKEDDNASKKFSCRPKSSDDPSGTESL